MSIADKLTQLETVRQSIVSKLQGKGSTIADSAGLSAVPNAIEALSGGGTAGDPYEKVLYSFGLLSDVHLKDTTYGEDTNGSVSDLERALKYYNDNGCVFLTVAGDIVHLGTGTLPSTDALKSAEWLGEVQLFKSMCGQYMPGKSVYACVGNHDANPLGAAESLSALVGLGREITKDGTTKTGKAWWEDTLGHGINHVVTNAENSILGDDDVLIFFSMKYWNYVDPVYSSSAMTAVSNGFTGKDELDWLDAKLEQYSGKRVLLFFHLPWQDTAYLAPTTNGLITSQTNVNTWNRGIFGRLMLKYPNVVWINGHSHYKVDYEGYSFTYSDDYQESETIAFQHPNVYKPDGLPTMVHCASCSHPRSVNAKKRNATSHEWDGTWTYLNDTAGSQGYVVDVYKDRVVFRGVDFAAGKMIATAQYVVNV